MIDPVKINRAKPNLLTIVLPFLRGFLPIIPESPGLTPKANAGNPSVTKFIHKICTAIKGKGSPITIARVITKTSPKLQLNKNSTNFLILSKTIRPSSTALTKEAKLSSVKIISDASLATSVPVIPIATPISAFFNAGASFTPSPVIAVTNPLFWNVVIILILCSGFTLA